MALPTCQDQHEDQHLPVRSRAFESFPNPARKRLSESSTADLLPSKRLKSEINPTTQRENESAPELSNNLFSTLTPSSEEVLSSNQISFTSQTTPSQPVNIATTAEQAQSFAFPDKSLNDSNEPEKYEERFSDVSSVNHVTHSTPIPLQIKRTDLTQQPHTLENTDTAKINKAIDKVNGIQESSLAEPSEGQSDENGVDTTASSQLGANLAAKSTMKADETVPTKNLVHLGNLPSIPSYVRNTTSEGSAVPSYAGGRSEPEIHQDRSHHPSDSAKGKAMHVTGKSQIRNTAAGVGTRNRFRISPAVEIRAVMPLDKVVVKNSNRRSRNRLKPSNSTRSRSTIARYRDEMLGRHSRTSFWGGRKPDFMFAV